MILKKLFIIVFIAYCINLLNAKQSSSKNRRTIQKAIEFMTAADRNITKLVSASAHALWNWQVNLTKRNQKIKEETAKAASKYGQKVYRETRKFKWRTYKGRNATLYRWFELAGRGLSSVESAFYNGKGQLEKTSPSSKMSDIFDKVKICPYKGPKEKCNMTLGKGITKVFAKSRDPEELKYYWLEFRKETGEKYKDLFLKSIEEDNKVAKGFGYQNKAYYNIAMYEDKGFLQNMAKEVKKILPLFKQMHAYVRKKLMAHYKNGNIQKDGPIPAHLLGNMYAQSWSNIFPIVKPYPKSSGVPDVTKAMLKKKMKPMDMFIMAERFFVSIGLKKMTPDFWKKSVITEQKGRNMTCHASAHDFFDGKDFRIKMCTQVNSEDLATIHHEMGHIQYYMYYKNLPVIFRRSANPGFHEAIGDAVSLSVLTPNYLRQVGLLKKSEIKTDKKSTINYLMKMALTYAVTPNYAYIIDHWRNQVYNGTIKPKKLNKSYWKYRLQYQGVCPPSRRTEKNFDIGAKYHIPAGVEYFRYFVASIVRFQIHKILCMKAGHTGPLHECNIYKKKNAGRLFASMLRQGRAKKWDKILRTFSGKLYNKVDASALLEYFKPLMDWLKKKNSNEYIGWKSKNPMSCPRSKSGSTGSGLTGTSEEARETASTLSTDSNSARIVTKIVTDLSVGSTATGSSSANKYNSEIISPASTGSTTAGPQTGASFSAVSAGTGATTFLTRSVSVVSETEATVSVPSGTDSRTLATGSIVSDSGTIVSSITGSTASVGERTSSFIKTSGTDSIIFTTGSNLSDSGTVVSSITGSTASVGERTSSFRKTSGADSITFTTGSNVSYYGTNASAITGSTTSVGKIKTLSSGSSGTDSGTKVTDSSSSKSSLSGFPAAALAGFLKTVPETAAFHLEENISLDSENSEDSLSDYSVADLEPTTMQSEGSEYTGVVTEIITDLSVDSAATDSSESIGKETDISLPATLSAVPEISVSGKLTDETVSSTAPTEEDEMVKFVRNMLQG